MAPILGEISGLVCDLEAKMYQNYCFFNTNSVTFFTSTFISTEVPLFSTSREVLYMVVTVSSRPSIWQLSWVKFQVWFAI